MGVLIDAACWGAVIGGGMYTAGAALSPGGLSQNWNLNDFGRSMAVGAVSGAVTAGMGLMAPSFTAQYTSFGANLPTYLAKAGYAAGTAMVATGAGMLTNDWLDDGKINTHYSNYLRGMGISGLTAGLMSFGSSIHQYATWDRYTYEQQADLLSKRYNTNVVYSPDQEAIGKWTGNYKDGFGVSLNKDAFSSQSFARHVTEHELRHISNLRDPFLQMLSKESIIRNDYRIYRDASEINTHTYSLRTASKHFLSARDWFGELSLMRSNYGYSGPMPNGLKFWMVLLNFR